MPSLASDPRVTVVTDLGYGDAGKGSVVDHLARTQGATAVVRYNGGSQAAHNVQAPDGLHHTFRQFGSATFIPNTVTHLSRYMLVSPLNLIQEADHLADVGVHDALKRITIDEDALIVTPYHRAANRLRELSRTTRHGSCGEGIGETMFDAVNHPDLCLRARDMFSIRKTFRVLEQIRRRYVEQFKNIKVPVSPVASRHIETLNDDFLSLDVSDFYQYFVSRVEIVAGDYLNTLLRNHDHLVFEGAQGVLLDEWHGFHPYTTWSTTTPRNAHELLADHNASGTHRTHTLGLLRAYHTRHGAGPFVTDDPTLTIFLPDRTNNHNQWQGDFRVGHFDAVAARYALAACGNTVDSLGITCLDRINDLLDWKVCTSYTHDNQTINDLPLKSSLQDLTPLVEQVSPVYTPFQDKPFSSASIPSYIDLIEKLLNLPVTLTSRGPTSNDKELHHESL